MSRSNRERTELTRQALLEAGRGLFVQKGYGDTATPEVAAAAGVTRGALYHHFEDKKALFRAVAEGEAAAVAASIAAAAEAGGTPRDRLLAGASAYFDAMARAGRTRLLLLEAPAVLGVADAAAVDADNSEASLHAGLVALLAGPAGPPALIGPLTALLSAAFERAAIAIDAGGDRTQYEAAIAVLVDGIADRLRR